MNMESHFRSIIKAITWRIGGILVTFVGVWVLTRKLESDHYAHYEVGNYDN